MKEVLRAHELSKEFRGKRALNELNLTVNESEIVCLLGANGAGKTTTINLFLGFLEPSAGQAYVTGLPVKDNLEAVRGVLGYVPEQVSLYPTLSGRENLDYFVKLSSNNKPRAAELRALFDRVGLAQSSADEPVSGYSKGMRQKVGLAIALAKGAKALLLDEPLSGLDPKAANEFCSLLRELANDGTAVLMATHDLFRAKEIADRIGIMRSGNLVDELSPGSLAQADLEQLYLKHMHDNPDSEEAIS